MKLINGLKSLTYYIEDYAYVAAGHLRSLGNPHSPQHWLDNPDAVGDVVLIQGLYERWHFLKPLGELLNKNGYRVHIVKSIRLNRQRINQESQKLHEYMADENLKNAIFVAHSKGALVALDYMLKLSDDPDHKYKLIAIAAPFSGSNIGRIARFSAVQELLPSNEIIKNMLSHSKLPSLEITSLYPSYDNHVWHHRGSILDGFDNIEHPERGHTKILFDNKLHKRVLSLANEFTASRSD